MGYDEFWHQFNVSLNGPVDYTIQWWMRLAAHKGGRKPWSWASLPGLWPKQHKGPSWVGHEAELFGGRRIEGMGLLTTGGRRCWLNTERRWA